MKRLSFIALALTLGAAACERAARSTSYFVAHPDERQMVLADCTSGKTRGHECEMAAGAAATAKHEEAEDYFRSSTGSK